MNIILDTDSYKASHFLQYPEDVKYVSSYIEARKEACLFFGLQAWINNIHNNPITKEHVLEAECFFLPHGLPFNKDGWMRIVEKHKGMLPISVSAADEGRVYLAGTPLVEIHNTDPELPWLTSYLETSLLRAIWYPSTVAKISYDIKQVIKDYLLATTGSTEGLEFKLHDFGSRGVSSKESAGIGAAAHLINFLGTDTIEGNAFIDKHYGGPSPSMWGYSIPAAEHSTITAWGRDMELFAYRNMLDKFRTGLVAIVADSYDIYNAVDHMFGYNLELAIKARSGTVVVRPDSGDPLEVLPKLLNILETRFGATRNKMGYKELPPCIRLIWGDGINGPEIDTILGMMKRYDWAASNIAFGMGGALLQKCDRDTLGFAMKASAVADADMNWRGISKDPITDPGKKSKTGVQIPGTTAYYSAYGAGGPYRSVHFTEIRSRAEGARA